MPKRRMLALTEAHHPDTIYKVEHLEVQPGRGRKPAFSPKHETEGEAKQALLMVIRRDPATFGYTQSRWKLSLIAEGCDWLNVSNESSLWRLLQSLGIHYKREREYVHSPNRHYLDKLTLIEVARLRAYFAPDRYVFLYLDELSQQQKQFKITYPFVCCACQRMLLG